MTASEKDKKHMFNMSLPEGFLNLADNHLPSHTIVAEAFNMCL